MQYLLLFHCNYGCTNAPQCYKYIVCIVIYLLKLSVCRVDCTVLTVTTTAVSLEYVRSHTTIQLQSTFDNLTSQYKATHCTLIFTGLPGPCYGSGFSRRLLTPKTRLRSLANLCSIFGGQRANEMFSPRYLGFFMGTSIFPYQYNSTSTLCSFTHLSRTLYNLCNWQGL